MNLLNPQNNNNKWKDKYLAQLDQQDSLVKETRDREALLCRAIIRLTLITKGFNQTLDPHLTRIHAAVKSGLNSAKLKAELEQITQAVIRLEDSALNTAAAQADLLFDFLIRQSDTETQEQTYISLRKQYESGQLKSIEELFQALLDSQDSQDNDRFDVTETELSEGNYIPTDMVSQQLLLLLENFDIPSAFEKQAEFLKERLQKPLTATSFPSLLDEYVSLLSHIKKHFQSEQKNIEDFLSELTEQLNDLDDRVVGAHKVTQQATINRNNLDQFVSMQMQNLQNSSINATTLEPLKQLINTRIEAISRQLERHRQEENQQNLQAQRQLDELANKIQRMEKESTILKSRLTLAQNKAIRDPLTGLPNRLAYDERLETELSRRKRYKTPLCLAIWDIDYFKRINDTLGHKAGDKILKIIAQLLSTNCRDSDFISRFGGEEFTMLLPETSPESALILTEKLRKLVEQSRFNSGDKSFSITLSCGISEFQENDQPEAVFERADQALYQAKNNGRNQCAVN
ncbi:MAG: diguanylate cyclase [Gammaproteobacteria bacterium HGW-Gammaproteobacteria-3]|nr:MAG: diguanylate cyclase [Gammaproteobacteria bacterium HGW-Gammaproteobacteria-3]